MGLTPFDANQLGSAAHRKNVIINGDFDIWQRGDSFASLGTYTADRWGTNGGADGGTPATVAITREDHTLGQTDIPGEPKHFFRVTNSDEGSSLGASHTLNIIQRIEGVRTLAGRTVTISFYARSSITDKVLGIYAGQRFGSGGSPSAAVDFIHLSYFICHLSTFCPMFSDPFSFNDKWLLTNN